MASFTGKESDGKGIVTVTRTGELSVTSSATFATSNGTATAPGDYTAKSGTLVFAEGATSRSFAVALKNDSLLEGTELVNLTLSNPVGAVLGGTSTARMRISDDDGRAAFVALPRYSVSESGLKLTVTLQRSGSVSASASVRVSTQNLTAQAPADYQAVAGRLVSFAAGKATATVDLNIKDDLVAEASEKFRLMLSSPVGVELGTQKSAVVTIIDND
jgi:hypothetical protein